MGSSLRPEPSEAYSPSPLPPPIPPKAHGVGDDSPDSEDTEGLDMGDGIEAFNLEEQPTTDTRQYNLGAGPEYGVIQGNTPPEQDEYRTPRGHSSSGGFHIPRGYQSEVQPPSQLSRDSTLQSERVAPSTSFSVQPDPGPTPTLHMYPQSLDREGSAPQPLVNPARALTPDPHIHEVTTLNPHQMAPLELYITGGPGVSQQASGPPSGQVILRNQAPVGTGHLAIPKVALHKAVTQVSPRETESDVTIATVPSGQGVTGQPMIQTQSFTGGVVSQMTSSLPQGYMTLPGLKTPAQPPVQPQPHLYQPHIQPSKASRFTTTIPRKPAPLQSANHHKIKVLTEGSNAPITPSTTQVMGIGDTGPPKVAPHPWDKSLPPGVAADLASPSPSDASEYSPRSTPTVIETRFSTMPLRSNLKGGSVIPGSALTMGGYHGVPRKSVQFSTGMGEDESDKPSPRPPSPPNSPPSQDMISIVRVRSPRPPTMTTLSPPPSNPMTNLSPPSQPTPANQDGVSIISVNTADGLEFGYPGNNSSYHSNLIHGNGRLREDSGFVNPGFLMPDAESMAKSVGHYSQVINYLIN